MDDNRIKGKFDDVKGRVKRQLGEWTGDENAQAEGTLDQAKGKVENAFGKVKDKARDIANDVRDDRNDRDRDVA